MTAFSSLRVLIPADLRHQVETRAAAEDTTVQDVVTDLLAGYVRRKPKRGKTASTPPAAR